jgi:hypothetical protein
LPKDSAEHTPEISPEQAGSDQDGRGEVRRSESSLIQVRTSKVAAVKIRPFQIRSKELGRSKIRVSEIDTGQVCARKVYRRQIAMMKRRQICPANSPPVPARHPIGATAQQLKSA